MLNVKDAHLSTIYLRIFMLTIQAGAIGIVFLLGLIVSSDLKNQEKSNEEVQAFCGVTDQTPTRWYGSSNPLIDSLANPRMGKQLWNEHICGSCHNKNMKSDATGPALSGVTERWATYPKEDLYAWIRNSQQLIAAKHPRALELWDQFAPTVMLNYQDLSDEEINHLLAFVEMPYAN